MDGYAGAARAYARRAVWLFWVCLELVLGMESGIVYSWPRIQCLECLDTSHFYYYLLPLLVILLSLSSHS
jgi:hypothetical protein